MFERSQQRRLAVKAIAENAQVDRAARKVCIWSSGDKMVRSNIAAKTYRNAKPASVQRFVMPHSPLDYSQNGIGKFLNGVVGLMLTVYASNCQNHFVECVSGN